MPQIVPARTVRKAGDQFEMMREDQIAGESQQRFVGDGQPYDTQHQQAKDSGIAIVRDPVENLMFHGAGG